MLRETTPQNERWYRNDSNCNWIVEDNPLFDKPTNWQAIMDECVKALNAVGLDIGACDVKVQSAKKKDGTARQNPDYFVIEINSAPSLKERGLQKYLVQIPQILRRKFIENQ